MTGIQVRTKSEMNFEKSKASGIECPIGRTSGLKPGQALVGSCKPHAAARQRRCKPRSGPRRARAQASSTKVTRRPRASRPRIAASLQTSVATPKRTISCGSSSARRRSAFGFVKGSYAFLSSRNSAATEP